MTPRLETEGAIGTNEEGHGWGKKDSCMEDQVIWTRTCILQRGQGRKALRFQIDRFACSQSTRTAGGTEEVGSHSLDSPQICST